MAQNDIGIDLGTTTIIIAQQGTGVVLNQPSVVAVDTRKNTVLEVGVRRWPWWAVPPTISGRPSPERGRHQRPYHDPGADRPFVNKVYSSHMVKPRVAVYLRTGGYYGH